MSYADDRCYGDRFVEQACEVIGPHLLKPSPFQIDTKQAADLIVLRAEAVEIGMRIRRPGYLQYQHEFTIRSHRDSGAETELSKVMNGWMQWMFYAHGNEPNEHPNLVYWMLIDMNVWRREVMKCGWCEARRRGLVSQKSNGDGTHFIACDTRLYPDDLLIARDGDPAAFVYSQRKTA